MPVPKTSKRFFWPSVRHCPTTFPASAKNVTKRPKKKKKKKKKKNKTKPNLQNSGALNQFRHACGSSERSFFEGITDGEDVESGCDRSLSRSHPRFDTLLAPAHGAPRSFCVGVVGENASHFLGGCGEKMFAGSCLPMATPLRRLLILAMLHGSRAVGERFDARCFSLASLVRRPKSAATLHKNDRKAIASVVLDFRPGFLPSTTIGNPLSLFTGFPSPLETGRGAQGGGRVVRVVRHGTPPLTEKSGVPPPACLVHGSTAARRALRPFER